MIRLIANFSSGTSTGTPLSIYASYYGLVLPNSQCQLFLWEVISVPRLFSLEVWIRVTAD